VCGVGFGFRFKMTQRTPKRTREGGAAKNDHNLLMHLALSPASLPTLHASSNLHGLTTSDTSLALSCRRHVLLLLLLLRL